jgi:hypothetical protein
MAIAFYAIPKLLFDGERGDKCVRHLFVQAAMLIRLHLQSAATHSIDRVIYRCLD